MTNSDSVLCKICECEVEPEIVDYYGNNVPACPDCEALI